MAAFSGEFDDASEDEGIGPLLPPEDRLWRHPSELGSSGGLPLDPVEVRVNWLQREPTRANAWTAGLVGALLATGIVIVGTHLATALAPARPGQAAASDATVTTVAEPPVDAGLGAKARSAITRVGGAIGLINVANRNGQQSVLGLVMGTSGMVLTAAEPFMNDADPQDSSILVTLPGDTSQLVGEVVGMDRATGLAVIHVNGVSGVHAVQFSNATPSTSDVYLAVMKPGGSRFAATEVTTSDVTPKLGGTTLVDASSTDLDGYDTPLGTPLVDSSGGVVGIVTGNVNGWAIFEPAWLAVPVARELQSFGSVRRGWLGIEGASEPSKASAAPAGVMVRNIVPKSAADRAGLRPGDLIVSLNGMPISSMPALSGHLYILKPGTTVSLQILRRGVRRTAPVMLGNALSY